MSLTVLSVAYPFAPVSLDSAGGAEQVLAQLDRAIVNRGWRSLVVAAEGSRVTGDLIAVALPDGELGDDAQRCTHVRMREAVHQALGTFDVDVIHMHGIDFHAYLPPPEKPLLVTLHLPPEWYPASVFRLARPATFLHCVSQSQLRRCPPSDLLIPPIPNGISLQDFEPCDDKDDYALALGRICPEKGFDAALDAAAMAGVPLVIAGAAFAYPEHQRYLTQEILPRLDGVQRRWIGAVGLEQKRELLARARCVLIPSLAPETSSLVAMEALASGTPVVAFRSGALPELIVDGETGFLVDNTDQMAAATAEVGKLSSQRCRKYAEEHFNFNATAEGYLETYKSLASRAPVAKAYAPRLRCEMIRDVQGLHELEPEWASLFRRCNGAPPFLHPAWQLNWWHTFGTCPLHTIAVRNGDHLEAAIPLFVYENRLVFIGNGISDAQDILASSDGARELAVEALASSAYGLDLQEIPEGSMLLRIDHEPCSVCPVLDLSRPLPAKLRKNVRLQQKYLEGEGGVQFLDVDEAASTEAIEHLIRFHELRWGPSGVLADARTQQFHKAVARAFAKEGMLRSWVLCVAGRTIGVFYGFASGGSTYYYLGGFDQHWVRFSPGSLLISHAIDQARMRGDHTFDFLRGSEPYKYNWGARDRVQYCIYTPKTP